MTLDISVGIPVGPNAAYKQWLDECIDSVLANDPLEVILIDDMAFLDESWVANKGPLVKLYKNDWLLGCADSWNRSVRLAKTDLVFLMGSDDYLLPFCLESVYNTYECNKHQSGWYNVTVELDNGDLSDSPNNAAAVTKTLWKETSGFPPCAFAAPDALLLSILIRHNPSKIIQVDKGRPLYHVRSHSYQDTPRQFGKFFEAAHSIRNIATRDFNPNDFEWTEKAI